jgi:guanosine-3',5'-bis(diphosphate) 3'-pyrophosphohydrolase
MHQISFFHPPENSTAAVHGLELLGERLATYLDPQQVNQIRRAYYYAEQAHEGQRRRSGEAYVTHPLAVAGILADMHMDAASLMAAMLHDVIEDTGISKDALKQQFGESVAELVDGVSKLSQMENRSRAEAQAENFQKMAMAMARDIRVILVKLADRLHNMRTLDSLNAEKRHRIASETLEIYAPIAQRLGMQNVRVELQDLSFNAVYPMRARRIRAAIKNASRNRKEVVEKITQDIEHCLRQEDHQAEVIGREKPVYSIYQKMKSKRKSFSEIMDIFAFRIIVDSVDTCYRVLGCMHNLYKPVPGQFKDYIAIPKANGYQSLHTVLIGLNGIPIEIQIRTREMEDMANNGIAAHWLYKSNPAEAVNGSHSRARRWVQGLLEMQQSAGNSLEFIETVKIDLFPNEIFVFTPRGQIIELPQGATPIDFAYAVHSDVGNMTVACKVNRRLAPLSEILHSGDTVEVITAPGAHPNPGWLNFVMSAKARTAIRHYLKHQRHSEAIELGQRLLEKALHSFGANFSELTEEQKNVLLANTGCPDFSKVLEEIGLGKRASLIAARQLLASTDVEAEKNLTLKGRYASSAKNKQAPLIIQGTEGFLINFAKCCYPIPGDHIVGHISAERGLVVHTEACHNSIELRDKPERLVALRWAENIDREFSVEIRVQLEKRRGIIAQLATKITSLDANIEKITVEDENPRISIIQLLLGVRSRVHLAQIMKKLRHIKAVSSVTRIKK